ncbi:MAG: serine hydrolase [Bdellovibrionales bacterium]|nr:serine hydrolase [Bdellovibrionales bacterium]
MRYIKSVFAVLVVFAIPYLLSFQSCSNDFAPHIIHESGTLSGDLPQSPPPSSPPPEGKSLYFPPLNSEASEVCDSSTWEYTSALSAGFNEERLNEFMSFVTNSSQHTTAIVILHRGKIVREWYSGKVDLSEYNSTVSVGKLNVSDWDCNASDMIHSASKSIVSMTIGIAEQEGRLNIEDPVSKFLGRWTNLTTGEEKIRIKHLLSMTSGLNGSPAGIDRLETPDGRIEGVLIDNKFQPPEVAWFYNTSAYHRLFAVIDSIGSDRASYIKEKIFDQIGMNDSVVSGENIRASGRDMARFGLLILAGGKWKYNIIINEDFVDKATSPFLSLPTFSGVSPDRMNKSYGFLFWLNGQSSWMSGACFNNLGQLKTSLSCQTALNNGDFNKFFIETAPADLIAALGAADKKIYIVPSLELVVARHGTPPSENESGFAESKLDSTLWENLMKARQ